MTGNLTRRVIALLAAVLVATCVLGGPAGGDTTSPDWLQLINSIRVANGLQPVVVNDSWASDIRLHLQYLADTPAQYRTGAYASAHTENPASPYYTAAGAAAGGESDLGGGATDIAAIDGWLSAPFHAVGILRPGLQTVGFYRDPDTGAAGLNVIGGLTGDDTHTGPIMYPAPGTATDIPAPTGGEFPNPLETCGWQSSGLPIILLLPSDPTADISAQLTRPDGSTVGTPGPDLCLVTKDTYVTTDPVYGPTGASILAGDHAVFVIPHTWLKPGSYTMRVTQSGQPDVVWSFTSAPAPVELSVSNVSRTDCGSASGTGSISSSIDVADDWNSLDDGSRAFSATVGTDEARGFTLQVSAPDYGVDGDMYPDLMLSSASSTMTVMLRDGVSSALIATANVQLPACASVPTSIDAARADRTVTSGNTLTLSGRLRQQAKGIALYGQTMSLMRRGIGSTVWTTRAVVTTDANGRANFGYRPTSNSEFRWVWSGSPAGDPSTGPISRVFVRPSVTGALSQPTVARGGVVRMKGTVAPAVAGARIVLQRYVSGSWRDFSRSTLSASGAYDFNVPTKVRGSRAYRVYRPADSRRVSATGPTRTLTVT